MDKNIINIACADDHPIILNGLISFINNFEGLQVIIEAKNGKELIKKIEQSAIAPDVCILDINMPVMNGFDTIIEIKKKWPEIHILVFTVHDLDIYIIRMIMYGASGYLLKGCDPDEIRKAIVSVYHHGVYHSEKMTRNFFKSVQNKEIKLPNLTANEIQVLSKCCTDLSYAQIAQKIGTTTRSVEGYRDSLFKKLKTNSRVSLALFAVQFGLVPLEINSSDDKKFLNKKIKKS